MGIQPLQDWALIEPSEANVEKQRGRESLFYDLARGVSEFHPLGHGPLLVSEITAIWTCRGTCCDLLVSSRTDCHQAASITEYLVGQVLFATGHPVTPAARLSGIRSSQGVSSS